MKENMYYGASNIIFQRAEELRKKMTLAEEILWSQLHINDWKLKFRRQHPIANYVVDFYCHSLKLVIEIDGNVHDQEEVKQNDIEREINLKALGLTIIRFKNEEVYNEMDKVIRTISEQIEQSKITSSINESIKKNPQDNLKNNLSHNLRNTPLGDGGSNKLTVIKIGGNIIDDSQKLASFLKDFAAIEGFKILIHGGGKLATKLAANLGIEQQMVDGRRITDAATLNIVTMVYAGSINKNIVAQLQANGCNALGLCGADANIIKAHRRVHPTIDYGFVGDVDEVNTPFIESLLVQNIALVLCPITHDGNGQLLNTNADTIAQETATAMSHLYDVSLIYSFEKAGVLLDVNNDASVVSVLNPAYYQELKTPDATTGEVKIFAGMIPKLDNAFAAINSGVHKVIIGKAEQLHELIAGEEGTIICA